MNNSVTDFLSSNPSITEVMKFVESEAQRIANEEKENENKFPGN